MNLAMQMPHMRLVKGFSLQQLAQEPAYAKSLISKLQHGTATPIAAHAASARGGAGYGYRHAGIGGKTAGRTYHSPRRGASHQAEGITLERLALPTQGGLLQANIHLLQPRAASDGTIVHAARKSATRSRARGNCAWAEGATPLAEGDAFTFPRHIPLRLPQCRHRHRAHIMS